MLYFTWTPMWVSSLLVPGKDVVWLNIPENEHTPPEQQDRGFEVNTVQIMANKAFLSENPAARRFFELVTIDIDDINAENALLEAGEDSPAEVTGHAQDWIQSHQALFDAWLAEARQAASL